MRENRWETNRRVERGYIEYRRAMVGSRFLLSHLTRKWMLFWKNPRCALLIEILFRKGMGAILPKMAMLELRNWLWFDFWKTWMTQWTIFCAARLLKWSITKVSKITKVNVFKKVKWYDYLFVSIFTWVSISDLEFALWSSGMEAIP